MKQAKKLLCMLLVMLLAFSTVSIGVNAAYSSYATPAGYNLHEEATYTTAQRASQLLDYVDEMLAELNFNEDYVVIKLNLTSVDAALDTVASLKSAAGAVGGDVKKLDFDAVPTTRRGTGGKTDLNILYELLYFLHANRNIVAKFVNGNLDLGIIGSFVDLDINVYELLVDMLYEMCVDENYDPDNGRTDWTADRILHHGLDVHLRGGVAANGEFTKGVLPSMSSQINLNTQTVWEIIELTATAATKDLLVPYLKNDLVALINEAKAKNPSAVWNLIDFSGLNLGSYVWGQYDSVNGIAGELNHFLYNVVNQVWKGEKFWVDGSNALLEQNLAKAIRIVYREFGTVILPLSAEFLPQEEIDAMYFEELVCYMATQFLRSEMPYLLWDTSTAGVEIPTDNFAAIICTIAYSILAELPVNSAVYIEDYELGNVEWGKETALKMVADIGAYYLSSALPIEINIGEGVETLVTKFVNWALGANNFGGFFAGCGVSDSDSAWTKIDKTVLTVLPLHKIFGGGATGSEDLIMNKIIDNVLNLNLEGILSLLYKTDYSLLNKTATEFAVDIVNRALGVIVTRNTQMEILNPNPVSIDSLIQNANNAVSVEKLFAGLYNAGRYEYFWASLLPIHNALIIDESGYACNQKPAGAGYIPTTSLASLQAYVESVEALMTVPEDPYNMNAPEWNDSVDYSLWRYNKLKESIADAWDVIDGYSDAVQWVEDANADLAAANASGNADEIAAAQANLADAQANLASYNADKYNTAGKNLSYYYEKVLANPVVPAPGDLQYIVYIIEYNDDKIEQYVEENYAPEVWENYQTALDHAYEILAIDPESGSGANLELKQSMVNSARRNLMDAMRLLENDLADLTALDAKLKEAKAVNTEGKTEESVKRLNDLIARAEEFVAGSWTIDYQPEIDQLTIDLQGAIDSLVDDCLTHEAGEPVRENINLESCTTKGSYDLVTYCSVCGEEISRETISVPATGHIPDSPVRENEFPAVPGSDGSYESVVYCTECGKEISRQIVVIPATGHTPGATVRENEISATCEQLGSYDEVVYCSCCPVSVELSRVKKTIEKLPHKEVVIPAVAATCTETGLTEGKKCSVCGTVTVAQTTTPQAAHTAGAPVEEKGVDATATTPGYKFSVVYCTKCNFEMSRTKIDIPALGHTPGEAREENRIEATESMDGSYEKVIYCIVCGRELSRETIILPSYSKANAKVTTVISKDNVKADDIVTVTVNLSTNFYIVNAQIPVLFDKTQFEVVGTTTNKNYLTFGEMFTERNYTFGGRADQMKGFDATLNPEIWNSDEAKAKYGVAYITATYDPANYADNETYAKPQDDVFATFQLKALTDVENVSESVFVSTDWAKTTENKKGVLTVGLKPTEEYDPSLDSYIPYGSVSYNTETIVISGVTVSGTVKSFNDTIANSDDVTINFYAEDSGEVAYTMTVTGSGVQNFEIDAVLPGTYTVKVSKANHATRTYTVVVDEEDVTIELVIHFAGDITGDGKINTIDVARANAHARGVSQLDDFAYICADVNGDGKVNTIDVAIINAHAKGTKSLWK